MIGGQERSCEAQIVNLRHDNLQCWPSGPGEQALPRALWMSRQPPTDRTFDHEGTPPHEGRAVDRLRERIRE